MRAKKLNPIVCAMILAAMILALGYGYVYIRWGRHVEGGCGFVTEEEVYPVGILKVKVRFFSWDLKTYGILDYRLQSLQDGEWLDMERHKVEWPKDVQGSVRNDYMDAFAGKGYKLFVGQYAPEGLKAGEYRLCFSYIPPGSGHYVIKRDELPEVYAHFTVE